MGYYGFIRKKAKTFVRCEILRDPQARAFRDWTRDTTARNLRTEYSLDPSSVVVDLGGYKGDFASEIFSQFGSEVYLFEPVPQYFEHCCARFAETPKIHCFPYAVGPTDGRFQITDDGLASSFKQIERARAPTIEAEMRAIGSVFDELALAHIDLLKINIEGGEYDVLPLLIESGRIRTITNIQVQFHLFHGAAKTDRDTIREALSRSHEEAWCYPFIWESWRLKDRAQSPLSGST